MPNDPTDRVHRHCAEPPPEAALILACARADTPPPHLQILCREPIDWERVLRQALIHGVLPVVYKSLAAHCRDRIPPPALASLHGPFLEIALRNRILAEELIAVRDLLTNRGIPMLAFKGPTLAMAAYGSLSLRQFADLDILVKVPDLTRARQILADRGYRTYFRGRHEKALPALTPAQRRSYLRHYLEYELFREDGLQVDLHWAFAPPLFPFRPAAEVAWQDSRTLSVLDREVPVPATELLLYILATHGAKERWKRLAWVLDLDRLVRRHPELDWDRVLNHASSARGMNVLRFGMGLSATLLGTPVPDALRHDRGMDRLIAERCGRLLESLDKGEQLTPKWPMSREQFALCSGWRDKLSYSVAALSTPRTEEFALIRLPDRLFALYWLVRPLWLLGVGTRRLVLSGWRRLGLS